ncbi:MAG: succinate dehydrogenase/fumarate reductase iron-sulfur subunit [Eggerthellaceae bacterium]|nr:succinate dehydrogenase/fumarate reductase iron-sulfur subunit [Eggerthellaceae bacterium]
MKISVQKYDPSVDEAPYVKEFEVEYRPNMTLLEALVAINDEQEPIVFDYSCRGRTCGRCAMALDGTPCLACVTLVKEDGANEVTALPGFPIVRDLIVDKSQMNDRIANIMARQRAFDLTLDEINAPVDPVIYNKADPLEHCARCGVCVSACPAVQMLGHKKYIGPAGMLAIGLRYYDPYDQGDRVVEAVQNGLWNCTMCGTCDNLCKALEIDHQSVWTDLRAAAEARGLVKKA